MDSGIEDTQKVSQEIAKTVLSLDK
jgi:hypothetical protein